MVVGAVGREDSVSTDSGLRKDEEGRFVYAVFAMKGGLHRLSLPPVLRYMLKSPSQRHLVLLWFD